MLDGTPVLDVKPFVPALDHRDAVQIGWFDAVVEQSIARRALTIGNDWLWPATARYGQYSDVQLAAIRGTESGRSICEAPH